MATRQTTPSSSPVVLAPTNSLKRALSEDVDSDSLPEAKKIRLKSENTPQSKDKKKRRKKKKKTPVVAGGSNGTPHATTVLRRASIDFGKGKRKAASAPPTSVSHLEIETEDAEGQNEDRESSLDTITELVQDDFQRAPETPVGETSSAAAVKLDNAGTVRPAQVSTDAESSSAALAKLKQELSVQASLLKKHETALAQFTQSLTCQICLDLLHKPYALAPCGHVSCYNCLVSWFTAVREPEEQFHRPRRKTCPHCRATIKERPVEVWSIKDMVAGLLKSGLVAGLSPAPPASLPLPGPPQPVDAARPPDPWHNIFRYSHQHPLFHPAPLNGGEPPSVEDMGMLDQEDGGVYRCLDCMHEIWNGICTSCHREYPGHADFDGGGGMFDDDDDDDSDGDPGMWPGLQPFVFGPYHPFFGNLVEHQGDDDESDGGGSMMGEDDGYDSFIDDGVVHGGGDEHAAAIIEIEDSDSEAPRAAGHGRRAAPANRRVVSSDDEDEDEDDHPPRRRRASTRVASPVDSDVIVVVSEDESDAPRPYIPRGARSRANVVDLSIEEEFGSHDGSDDESIIEDPGDFAMGFHDQAILHMLQQHYDDPDNDEDPHEGHVHYDEDSDAGRSYGSDFDEY
ncbi:hypothetical protein B0H16DRAFT_1699790 [Mycena metata]|uniref:RING-type domain-containing protein n=1 Tax=Mycena metata TaxID=1033252 RepID=A0AAD7HIT8_9AGAR|nr:hypothetical protein B0H16DRAFT_1699790 [Mycena metata]